MTRSVVVPTDTARATDALLDPDLLSAWIGPWDQHRGSDSATVVTDDGTVRRVENHREDGHGNVSWSWYPEDHPAEHTTVTIEVAPLGESSTLVTIHESPPRHVANASMSARASSAYLGARNSTEVWTANSMALGAVCLQRVPAGL